MSRLLRSLTIIAACSLLLAAGAAEAAGKAPRHLKKNAGEPAVAAIYTDSGPEPLLAKVFDAIESNRLEVAMQQTEMLIKAYPNFRLAHLVMGDLLLARSRPLMAFGEGGGPAAGEKVADLRDEAIVRLKGYRTKPPADYVPRYLLQMRAEQKYAVVVDTQKSRLYLYQNDHGTPRFVADYYITQGKLGADKAREGDRRTPIGVYHVTSSLPRQKLGDFYGSGAFPINYPNDWDKRHGRNGHGIWLHGTPSDTFSRPPKASDGCVVLANQDLDTLSKSLQIGLTPVIISNSIEWLSLDDWQSERTSLLKNVEEWRQDWESRNIDQYARHYSHKFNSDGQGYQGWIEQKRKVNAAKSWVKVGTGNISMFRNPGNEEYVVVTFEQDYRSSNLSNQMKKRQYWIKEGGNWKIVSEGAA
ncbi:MAG: L,D-transpeptidase family protein [Sulfuritalea sp.]|jgi:murein L,D-transpeptidase YafK|nr:L,D-transpeptidase family protein [Sulfuritalea sp.]